MWCQACGRGGRARRSIFLWFQSRIDNNSSLNLFCTNAAPLNSCGASGIRPADPLSYSTVPDFAMKEEGWEQQLPFMPLFNGIVKINYRGINIRSKSFIVGSEHSYKFRWSGIARLIRAAQRSKKTWIATCTYSLEEKIDLGKNEMVKCTFPNKHHLFSRTKKQR